ncbi:hypothetical protein ABMA28_008527 [Loxostege sticticalis]|uniref:unspecific monooxygenase n=1 Tax=Loxostege sticticalis TaxID=481309 RepID=A0ABD0SHH9_LOXSC
MIFLLLIFAATVVAVYFYKTKTFNYWAKKGVKHEKPVIFFGNNVKNFLMMESRAQAMERMYWKYPKEKVVGFYRSSVPELVLRDPALIKSVLVSDFGHFHMRGFHPYPKNIEPVIRHLFVVEGDYWRMLRQKMTPAFTSGKLKAMFPLIVEKAEKLQVRTSDLAKPGEPLDARDLMARYTTDFIGSIGFGLDADSMNKENSEFRKIGNDTFNPGLKEVLYTVLQEFFPFLAQNLKVFGRLEKPIFDIVKQVKESKGNKPTNRGDFIDQLLEYQQKGPIEIESLEKFKPDGTPEKVVMELDDTLFAAQVFLFFAAGFETSSSTTSTTLHHLAFNPEEQKKVQKEIDEVLARHNNKLSYDAVKEMKYLECAFKEGIRLFPALGYLMRACAKKYTFEDIGLTIDPGVKVMVPVKALHMDPAYWEQPWEFRPERFLPENFTAAQKSVFFPFGEGPRNCIGGRLGLMQSLAGIAAVMARFSVEPAPNSIKYPDVDPVSDIVQCPKGLELPLIFKERKSNLVH